MLKRILLSTALLGILCAPALAQVNLKVPGIKKELPTKGVKAFQLQNSEIKTALATKLVVQKVEFTIPSVSSSTPNASQVKACFDALAGVKSQVEADVLACKNAGFSGISGGKTESEYCTAHESSAPALQTCSGLSACNAACANFIAEEVNKHCKKVAIAGAKELAKGKAKCEALSRQNNKACDDAQNAINKAKKDRKGAAVNIAKNNIAIKKKIEEIEKLWAENKKLAGAIDKANSDIKAQQDKQDSLQCTLDVVDKDYKPAELKLDTKSDLINRPKFELELKVPAPMPGIKGPGPGPGPGPLVQ